MYNIITLYVFFLSCYTLFFLSPSLCLSLSSCVFVVENVTMDFGDGSSSDEDDPFDMIGTGNRRGNDRDGGDPLGEVYPYAWALDGRRIGENTPVVRPSSPTSSFVSEC